MDSTQPITHKGFKTTTELIAGIVVLVVIALIVEIWREEHPRPMQVDPYFNITVSSPTPISNTPTWLYNLESSGSVEAVFQGLYLGKTAYYVRSRCCDNYNDLYNQSGDIICSPDGGLTGNGDGKCSSAGKEFSRKGFKKIWSRPNI